MWDNRPEPSRASDAVERAAGFRDGDELFRSRTGREVMTKGECFDGIAGLTGDDEQGASQFAARCRRPHRCRIGAVQHVEVARTERCGEHVGDETRAAHAAHEDARQPVGADGRCQRGEFVPLGKRFLRRRHPPEQIHWRANIMRII